jgi:hypothetical protein
MLNKVSRLYAIYLSSIFTSTSKLLIVTFSGRLIILSTLLLAKVLDVDGDGDNCSYEPLIAINTEEY